MHTCLPASALQVNKWGFAPGADDTLAIHLGGEDTLALLEAADLAMAGGSAGSAELAASGSPPDGSMGEAAEAAASEGGSALRDGMAALRLSDCKENIVAEGCAAGISGRQLREPGIQAAALQPLDSQQAAAVGAAVEADAGAEAALAAGLPDQDSFGVYADSDGCSPPLMGSPTSRAVSPEVAAEAEAGFVTPVQQALVLGGEGAPPLADPFSPGFHARMLSCLEPAVAEVRLGQCVISWMNEDAGWGEMQRPANACKGACASSSRQHQQCTSSHILCHLAPATFRSGRACTP